MQKFKESCIVSVLIRYSSWEAYIAYEVISSDFNEKWNPEPLIEYDFINIVNNQKISYKISFL